MLIRLIYASIALDGVDLTNSSAFCCKGKLTITTGDLTGMQALEGSRDQVDELYAWLIRAPRHNSITMLGYKKIEARHWSSWSMVFAAPNFDNRALFLNYSLQGTFKS